MGGKRGGWIAVIVAGVIAVGSGTARAQIVYDTLTVYNSSDQIIAQLAEPDATVVNSADTFYLSGIAVDKNQNGNF